jgi:hypothetical protein
MIDDDVILVLVQVVQYSTMHAHTVLTQYEYSTTCTTVVLVVLCSTSSSHHIHATDQKITRVTVLYRTVLVLEQGSTIPYTVLVLEYGVLSTPTQYVIILFIAVERFDRKIKHDSIMYTRSTVVLEYCTVLLVLVLYSSKSSAKRLVARHQCRRRRKMTRCL